MHSGELKIDEHFVAIHPREAPADRVQMFERRVTLDHRLMGFCFRQNLVQ